MKHGNVGHTLNFPQRSFPNELLLFNGERLHAEKLGSITNAEFSPTKETTAYCSFRTQVTTDIFSGKTEGISSTRTWS